MLEGDEWLQWKKRRRNTFISFILVGIMVGIDYSVVFSTLYLYLKNTIKTPHSEFYYGIIIAVFQISSSLFGIVTGRWLDRTRRVKLFTNIILLMQILGALLYVIPSHVWFPLVGRFIAGAGDPFISVCTGEVVRIYDEHESTQKLWWLASCYSLGMVVGPVIPLAFERIHFKIGPISVGQYNFIGVFMASLFIVVMVISNLLMHDCSKQFDLKAHEQMTNNDVINDVNDNPFSTNASQSDIYQIDVDILEEDKPLPSALHTIKKLCLNVDVVLLFVSTLVCMYAMFSVDVLVPLVFEVILQWTLTSLAIFLVASGVVYATLLFLMSKYCTSNTSLYVSMIACLLGAVLMYLTLIAIKFKDRVPILDYVLVILLGVFWLLTTCIEEVLIRAILARKVQSSVQSFTEALRNGLASSAAILGAISTPLLLPVVDWWSIVMMIVLGIFIGCYILRRRTLVSADVIDFESD